MAKRPALNLKWAVIAVLGLPLVMALLRLLWPDISWGFLFLFGLQVMLLLATLQLVATSIWQPGSRWKLPGKGADAPRRIFVKKGALVRALSAVPQRVKAVVQAPVLRLLKRKAP
jgi:hypothetical protein